MRFISDEEKKREFTFGLRDGLPICLGYLAVSFAFGIKVCADGFPVWLAGLISFTNVTSAGQFAGTTLIVAGASYLELIVSMLVINARYFLMSLSLSQNYGDKFPGYKRLATSYGITDEIFAVSVGRGKNINPTYMHGLILISVFGWVLGTMLGGTFSQILPEVVVGALGIALYGMFIAIVIPPAKEHTSVLITVLLAATLSVAIAYVPFLKFISSGWSTIIVTVVVAGIAATLFPVKDETDESGESSKKLADGEKEDARPASELENADGGEPQADKVEEANDGKH